MFFHYCLSNSISRHGCFYIKFNKLPWTRPCVIVISQIQSSDNFKLQSEMGLVKCWFSNPTQQLCLHSPCFPILNQNHRLNKSLSIVYCILFQLSFVWKMIFSSPPACIGNNFHEWFELHTVAIFNNLRHKYLYFVFDYVFSGQTFDLQVGSEPFKHYNKVR